ncbi:amidohydrolase [Vitiosangium sp. GDMCC 1.1324]|uniref:amidohydrolase n=1 Tax=Vitiosangium sp. (strain GDMCC 1.1324) TaxID=2138576 RepID=UPI00130DDE0F|nr:amidohydrolase family protein [Vitiosangium sp. GDMCC 1.1324]
MSAPRTTLLATVFTASVLAACASTPARHGAKTASRVFLGKVRTMDARDTVAKAVAVDARGLIVAVGTEQEVMAFADDQTKVVKLDSGQTLLPGFLDSHMHVVGLMQQETGLVSLVGACRPQPYAEGNGQCSNFISESLQRLGESLKNDTHNTFVVAMNLDPSRQQYDAVTSSAEFKKCPAQYIEKLIPGSRPMLIIDQSGHFGYVNRAAFDALKKVRTAHGQAWPPALSAGSLWNTTTATDPCSVTYDDGGKHYTGLLTELDAYNVFFPAIEDQVLGDLLQHPDTYVQDGRKGATQVLSELRQAGITTLTSMAQTKAALQMTRLLAMSPASGTRMLSVVPADIATQHLNSKPILPSCNPLEDSACQWPKDLGVNGIKMIADGSTQGCTAALSQTSSGPQYLSSSECAPPDGHIDFSRDYLINQLSPLWKTGLWRFETHANGNRSIRMVLDAYATLQQQQPNDHTATLIHATVGEESLWKDAGNLRNGSYQLDGNTVPKVRLHFTHLIGHVAYWGAVFERQLGKDAAAYIDATGYDKQYGIPFSFHSDAPVSVPRPLWFIRQAVTRETWTYPELTQQHVLGAPQQISVRDALRAVTLDAAKEKELDPWIGSIEVGKVADFVVLSEDPVDYEPKNGGDPTKISSIKVVNTYLGGIVTGASSSAP